MSRVSHPERQNTTYPKGSTCDLNGVREGIDRPFLFFNFLLYIIYTRAEGAQITGERPKSSADMGEGGGGGVGRILIL